MRRLCALVLVCAVLIAGCGDDDDSSTSATTTSTTRTTSTTATSIAPAPVELGAARVLGDGTFVGVHPTEPIAFVSIVDHDTKEVGCEGGDVARLWAQPLAGGTAVRVLPDSFLSGVVLSGGFDGRVAVVDSCEGFLSSLTIARPDAEGRFEKVEKVDTTAAESDGQLQPGTIRWSSDGRSFLAIVHLNDSIERTIGVRISLDGTVTQLVEGDALLAIADLADGRIVTATASHLTVSGDTPIELDLDITSIAISPDGQAVAAFGGRGIEVVSPRDKGHLQVTTDAASVGSWSPDGDHLAYLALANDSAGVRVMHVSGEPTVVTEKGGFGAPMFSADRHFVVYNDAVDSGQGFDEPRAMARPITSS